MEEEHIRKVMRETVMETLLVLGFDTHQPYEMQKDLVHLRKIRKGNEDIARGIRATLIAVSVTSAIYALWEAIKRAVNV